MRSISPLIPAFAAAMFLGGPGLAQTTTGTPDTAAPAAQRTAPAPEEIAARIAAGQGATIHAPGETTRIVGSAAGAGALASGTTIAVPATARVNTVTPGVTAVAADGYTAEVYPDTYYLDLPYYDDSPTVVEYESLIRAGGPPRYSVSTLHTSRLGGPYYYSRPYYSRPYSYHHDRYSLHRQDRHYRPYSSHLGGRGPYSSYDALGGALHRDAVLRFHRGSYPRNLDGRDRNPRIHGHRPDQDRSRHRADRDRGDHANRDRGHGERERGRVERRESDRPRTGYRRDSGGGGHDSGRSGRGGASRSPK